jgi:hypothetical protein
MVVSLYHQTIPMLNPFTFFATVPTKKRWEQIPEANDAAYQIQEDKETYLHAWKFKQAALLRITTKCTAVESGDNLLPKGGCRQHATVCQ